MVAGDNNSNLLRFANKQVLQWRRSEQNGEWGSRERSEAPVNKRLFTHKQIIVPYLVKDVTPSDMTLSIFLSINGLIRHRKTDIFHHSAGQYYKDFYLLPKVGSCNCLLLMVSDQSVLQHRFPVLQDWWFTASRAAQLLAVVMVCVCCLFCSAWLGGLLGLKQGGEVGVRLGGQTEEKQAENV